MAYGWTPRAHAPAILKLPDIDLIAVCTAHKETAIESAEKYGATMAFHNHNEMLEKADESGWLVLDTSIGDPVRKIGDSFE